LRDRIEVYSVEFEEGLRMSYDHALQLIDSANFLEAHGKHNSAKFLALHSREELGRALLILDDIKSGKPGISEARYEDKLCDHKHKLRRIHLAVVRAIGYKEGEVTISNGKNKGFGKVVPDGEVIKNFANYDMENRDRSLYVEHALIGGKRKWISPLNPVGFTRDAGSDIEYSKLCCDIVKGEAKKQGIIL